MNLTVDTSVIIAVITNEAHKGRLIKLTKGAELIAPRALHWEIGNAFSAMFKRKRINLQQAITAIDFYKRIPLRFCDIEIENALEISSQLKIYAYDAYFIACASKYKSSLVSLDSGQIRAAQNYGVRTLEVSE